MTHFTFFFHKKSNRYIFVCTLLLFFLFPFHVNATEDSTFPIENTTSPIEEIPLETYPVELPEEITLPEIPPVETHTIELPESNNIYQDIPIESMEISASSTDESFSVEAFHGTYYISSSGGLNVRRGPSIEYDIIGSLPYGEEISVSGKTHDNWFEIRFQGMTGYISSKYVSPNPIPALPFETEAPIEEPETLTEEPYIENHFSPFIPDTTLFLLFIAIIATIVVIIITIFSFFRINTNNYDDYHDQSN